MATLVVGGVTVPVAAEAADEKNEFVGEKTRMQDGTMRAIVITNKRSLSITTRHMLDADAATLKAALLTTTLPVACSGDILGGTVNCFPELTGYKPVRRRGALYRIVAFSLVQA